MQLADLLAEESFGLELLTGGADAPVRGAHAVEVDAPARWLAAEWIMLTTGVRLRGNVEALVRFHAATADTFPDATVTLDDAVAEGDRVATRFTWRASQGPGWNLVAQGGAIVRFADGQIVECWNLPTDLRAIAAA